MILRHGWLDLKSLVQTPRGVVFAVLASLTLIPCAMAESSDSALALDPAFSAGLAAL